jgi:ATP-dependent helicase HrpA
MRTSIGDAVGYKVRFADKTTPGAWVKIMTDGILLAETRGDRDLLAYDTIIVDEAHERSLNIDFLLGYLKQLIARRPDLKVVITSATLDADRFARHFGVDDAHPAPVIEVSGRLVPGRDPLPRRPAAIPRTKATDDEEDVEEAIVDATGDLWREGPGDILAFLPGEREIRETADLLRADLKRRPWGAAAEILPLYARLSPEEQQRAFAPSRGPAHRARDQRGRDLADRAGHPLRDRHRGRAHQALRVAQQDDAPQDREDRARERRPARGPMRPRPGRHLRAPVPGGRLRGAAALRRARDPAQLARERDPADGVARPRARSTRSRSSSRRARARSRTATSCCRSSARSTSVACSPTSDASSRGCRSTRASAASCSPARERGCLAEALVIASALSVPDPRERPLEKAQAADQAHLRFRDERSDFLSLINLWQFFSVLGDEKLSHRRQVDRCREVFVNHLRMREWRDVHRELAAQLAESGYEWNDALPASIDATRYRSIHESLLAGCFPTSACATAKARATAARAACASTCIRAAASRRRVAAGSSPPSSSRRRASTRAAPRRSSPNGSRRWPAIA